MTPDPGRDGPGAAGSGSVGVRAVGSDLADAVGTGPGAQLRFSRAAILGVGMIGGSFAAALRERDLADVIVGYGPSQPPVADVAAPAHDDRPLTGDDLAVARDLRLIDHACRSVDEAVEGADLVVLAAPIPVLPELLRQVAGRLSPSALITDCASTKLTVLAAARASLGPQAARFVAAHPIAGSERSGPRAARADLFDGCKVMLCAQQWTAQDALIQATALWAALGAEVVPVDAHEHDRLYAELSHWPHVVAFALSAMVAEGEFAEAALRLSGAGLRDTTRIGASSPSLWADILLDNRAYVLDSAERFQRELDRLRAALMASDRDELVRALQIASQWRQRLPGV